MASHERMIIQISLSHLTEYYVALKTVSLKLFCSVGKCFQKLKWKRTPKPQNGIGDVISSTLRKKSVNQNNSDYL